MRIGTDFEKIDFTLFGLDLLEPNSLIGNSILFLFGIGLALKVHRLNQSEPFFKYWMLFFINFGFSFGLGGLGHVFFNYWGITGKYAGWCFSIVSIYFMERAMLSLYESRMQSFFILLTKLKLFLFLALEILVFSFLDLETNPQIGLAIPSIGTAIGFTFCLGYLARVFTKKISPSFNYFFLSIFILIPGAVVQSLKIGIVPWFDRNDISHLLLLFTIIVHWMGVKAYNNSK